jgi:hypothetical protein
MHQDGNAPTKRLAGINLAIPVPVRRPEGIIAARAEAVVLEVEAAMAAHQANRSKGASRGRKSMDAPNPVQDK